MTSSLEATDRASAEIAVAPRVRLRDIEDAILETFYFTAGQALAAREVPYRSEHLDLLTIAVVAMKNGFVVIGKSAPASPENFDELHGRKLAYEDAIRQLWPMMGFALREKLAKD